MVEHHLPARVERCLLHRLRVRKMGVALQQQRHRKQRRRDGRLAGTATAVHRLELGLKSVIEKFVPVHSQKSKEFAGALQSLHHPLFALGQRRARVPSVDLHRSPPASTRPRPRAPRQRESRMITYDHTWSRRESPLFSAPSKLIGVLVPILGRGRTSLRRWGGGWGRKRLRGRSVSTGARVASRSADGAIAACRTSWVWLLSLSRP